MADESDCSVCGKNVNGSETSIELSLCYSSIHKRCTGISDAEFHKISGQVRKSVCIQCKHSEKKKIQWK